MLPGPFISAFTLLESRDILHNLLSMPFVSSFILIYIGFDPAYVLSTALVIHTVYLYHTPSGASEFPEYPFAFFTVIYATGTDIGGLSERIFIILLIMLVSRITGRLMIYKRNIFFRFKGAQHKKNCPVSIVKGVLLSYTVYFLYSSAVIALIGLIPFGRFNLSSDLSEGYFYPLSVLVVILTLYYSAAGIRKK